jgi:glucosamine 6-phosphate synthetase-like amidotransferase/phosphosugar isomerase protein
MCGICGIYGINGLTKEDILAFQRILVNCESRGTDAFGYYSYPNKVLFKTKGSVSKYLKKEKDLFEGFEGINIILAHTRATTKGSEEKNQNNHPFETENFILAHNGVIWNTADFGYKTDIETDSYVIIRSIQEEYTKEKDVVGAIRTTCEKLEGNFACWLLFKNTGAIYLFRHGNPIDIRYDNEKKLIVFASEKDMMLPLIQKSITGFWKSLFFSEIRENTIYRINKDGGLVDCGEFTPKERAYSYGYYNNIKKKYSEEDVETLKNLSNSEMEAEIFKRTGLNFSSVQGMLDYYGIVMFIRGSRIHFYFNNDQSYEAYREIFNLNGFTISPTTRILSISSMMDFEKIVEIAEEGFTDYMEELEETKEWNASFY